MTCEWSVREEHRWDTTDNGDGKWRTST